MSEEFSSHIVKSSNIELELKKLSSQYEIPVSKFDLHISKIMTLYKDSPDDTWSEASAKTIAKLEDSEYLTHEDLEIKQTYEVTIFPKVQNSEIKLVMGLGTNSVDTIAVLLVKAGSYLDNSLPQEQMRELLNDEINKLKLKKNIFVNIWDREQKLGIRVLLEEFAKNSILTKDIRFTITRVKAYEEVINDKMIYHYKDNEDNQKSSNKQFMANDKVDHYDRGSIIGVKEGDLIMEYIKPRDGVDGKSFRGETIRGAIAVAENIPAFVVATRSIKIQESDDNIKYYAQKKGFVSFEDGRLDILEHLDIQSVDMRSTGHIKAGVDTGIILNLEENDPLKDAIGTGVHIEMTGINVKGNVAGDTILQAASIDIDGQTHGSSKIECDNANIKIHKGELKAVSADIGRLEHGRIDADEVTVSEMVGGEIRANRVKINTLYKNATIYANDAIEIDNIKGDDNLFVLSPLARLEDKEEYEVKRAEYLALEDKLKYVVSTQKEVKSEIAPSAHHFKEISTILKEHKTKGETYPQALVWEYKKLKQEIQEYNNKTNSNKGQMKEYKELKKELQKKELEVLNAKIIKNTPWDNYFNKIVFELVFIKNEIGYQPKTDDELIKLIRVENKYKIEATQNKDK
jgi:nitrate reductase NapAB chaperone NapD